MDFEMDSDLDDILEIDTDDNMIRPYLYEPRKRETVKDHELSSEDEDPSSPESDRDGDTSECSGDGSDIPDVSEWCSCGNCERMPTLQECKCCTQTHIVDGKMEGLTCFTQHEGFIANCLNIHVLEASYFDYVIDNGPLEEDQLIHELCLAGLHFNENTNRRQAVTKAGTPRYAITYPKARRGEAVAKEIKEGATFGYVDEIMAVVMQMREQNKSYRQAHELRREQPLRPCPLAQSTPRRLTKEEVIAAHRARFNK